MNGSGGHGSGHSAAPSKPGNSGHGSSAPGRPSKQISGHNGSHAPAPGRQVHSVHMHHSSPARVHPVHRDFVDHGSIGHFYGRDPHYFGYRVRYLPTHYVHSRWWGLDYYFYDGVFYRPWGAYYRVCRPPFGYVLADLALDATLAALDFAFYNSVYHSYNVVDDNYATIAEQNRIIAENNATIAATNATIAANNATIASQQGSTASRNDTRATESYELASSLGLVQSYADASVNYYYQDGTFYTVNADGKYQVIVPPAGALVESLPDDYDTIVLNGTQYYRVDETVYRSVIVDGKAYLEVLGQLMGDMAKKYGVYTES